MTSSYDEIFSRFYLRVQDYNLSEMSDTLVKEMLSGYLRSTLSKSKVRKLFSSVTIDDDIEEIEYQLRNSWGEGSDQDFVENLLAIGMVCEWVSPRYHSTLLTSQFFSNAEQKYYSQSAHMAELKEMYNKAQRDLDKEIRDRGWQYSPIAGVT